MECHSTANGMSIDCQWSVTQLPPTDIPVTFEWQSSGSWMSLECHSNLFVCFFVCLFVCLFVQVTFKWHSSDSPVAELSLECHSTVTGMSFMAHCWHKGGGLGNNTPFVSQVEWHSSDIRVTVQWKLNVTWVSLEFVCLFFCLFICLFVCSSDIQVTFKWHSVTFEWHSSGTWVALYW